MHNYNWSAIGRPSSLNMYKYNDRCLILVISVFLLNCFWELVWYKCQYVIKVLCEQWGYLLKETTGAFGWVRTHARPMASQTIAPRRPSNPCILDVVNIKSTWMKCLFFTYKSINVWPFLLYYYFIFIIVTGTIISYIYIYIYIKSSIKSFNFINIGQFSKFLQLLPASQNNKTLMLVFNLRCLVTVSSLVFDLFWVF